MYVWFILPILLTRNDFVSILNRYISNVDKGKMTKGTWFKPLYEDPLSLEPEDSRNNNIEHQTRMNKKPSSKPIECMYNLDCLLYYLVQIVE